MFTERGNPLSFLFKGICCMVYGVGFNSEGLLTRHPKGLNTKEYTLWLSVLRRCYSKDALERNPKYKGVVVDSIWHDFSMFQKDIVKFISFGEIGFALDKDLLSYQDNKIYSKKTCCFLPKEINSFLSKCNTGNLNLPIGVSNYNGKIHARLGVIGLNVVCNSVEEAFSVYKKAKEAYAKVLADKWKDKIDPRAYEALMNYQV